MIRVLITGENSYIGNNLKSFLNVFKDEYSVQLLSMKDIIVTELDLSNVDICVHVAGIAHDNTKNASFDIYDKVNRLLTEELAQQCRKFNVKQFIFLSSIIIYGRAKGLPKQINKETPPSPDSAYGQSKLDAETSLRKLESDTFKVSILRLPMVYGKGSKGNFPRLVSICKVSPIFPNFVNKRSAIYIDHVTKLIKIIIDQSIGGVFYPQNNEYFNTSHVVKKISSVQGKNIHETKIFNWAIKLALAKSTTIQKLFGSVYYEQSISDQDLNYCSYSIDETIEKSI